MMELLRDVLENYVATRAMLNGRATVADTPDHRALKSEIPRRLEAHLLRRGVADLYKIKGSIGNGNIARVPWVGIFRKSITQNAENGFYIVLLFAEDMSSCCLSLNQGVTAVERLYTKSFAWKKMGEAASKAALQFPRHPEAVVGPISLKATGDLGRGYQIAAIESFVYPAEALPTDEHFFADLDHLLANYLVLAQRFDSDLFSLFTVREEEFQLVALEKAAAQQGELTVAVAGGVPVGDGASLGSKGYVRSPVVAANAIRAAKFLCEIDESHWTFISHAKQQRYVEAHHLIPISQQKKFQFSLDVVSNIVALCATCHRRLHYGHVKEKKALLRALLTDRREKMRAQELHVSDSDFYKFYAHLDEQDD